MPQSLTVNGGGTNYNAIDESKGNAVTPTSITSPQELIDQIADIISDPLTMALVITTIAMHTFINITITTQEGEECGNRERSLSIFTLGLYLLFVPSAYCLAWYREYDEWKKKCCWGFGSFLRKCFRAWIWIYLALFTLSARFFTCVFVTNMDDFQSATETIKPACSMLAFIAVVTKASVDQFISTRYSVNISFRCGLSGLFFFVFRDQQRKKKEQEPKKQGEGKNNQNQDDVSLEALKGE